MRRTRGLRVGAVAVLVAVVIVACDSKPLASSTPAAGGPSTGPTGTAGGSVVPVTIDPTLLAVLPRTVDSLPLLESQDADANALADTVMPTIASAAVGVEAGDPSTKDVVTGFVIKVRPGVFTEGVYRDWRDTSDTGVCGGEGQVLGNAQRTIGGNTVYIGTCANGVRTYHTWLQDRSILISLSSFGDRQLAVVLLETLPT